MASPTPGGGGDAAAARLLPRRAERADDVGLLEYARRLGVVRTVEAALDARAGLAGLAKVPSGPTARLEKITASTVCAVPRSMFLICR